MSKRIFSLFLALCCVLTLLPAAAPGVSAAQLQPQEVSIPTQVNPLYADVLDVEDFASQLKLLERPEDANTAGTMATDTTVYCDMTTAAAQIREGMVNREETITVYYYADGRLDAAGVKATVGPVLAKAMAHTGVATEGDYLLWQWGTYSAPGMFQYDEANDRTNIQFDLTFTYYTTAEQEAQMDTAVDALLSELALDGAAEYDQIKGIYDYICANVTYDYANLNDDTYKLKYSGYAALVNKTAVCQGYAVLFYRLALELGLDARVITGTGNGGAHAWNIVQIGDHYYNLDSTWDAGSSAYSYFLTSDANFGDHTRGSSFASDTFYQAYPMSSTDYASGTCGENACWALENGVLTISGEGAIYDYEAGTAPWYGLNDQIVGVSVQDGITAIGACAFNGLTSLTTVTLGGSVTTIGAAAFGNCAVLNELALNEGLVTIGAWAFAECDGLTEVTIPGSVTAMEDSCFFSCDSLTTATIAEGASSMGTMTFDQCTALETVVIPGSVTTVGSNAFNGCTSLKNVTLGEGITTIGLSAFNGCTSLTELTLPASLVTVNHGAFCRTGLTAITFGENVASLGHTLFEETPTTEITFLGSAPTFQEDTLSGLTATAYYPADNETWTEEIMTSYGGTITWVAVYPTSGTCGENAYWTLENGVLTISGEGAMDEHAGSPEEYPWYALRDQITAVVVESGVTNVGGYAFAYDYPNLQRADLNVETVGDSAFDGCTSLTEVAVSASLTTIGGRAFAETGITAIDLPEGLTAIGGEAFMGSKLTEISIPGTVTEWGYDVFTNCTDLKHAELGEGLTEVYSHLFADCTALETVEIPGTATYIGEGAFQGCSALDNVVIPDGVTALYTEAFGDCVSLTSVEIPASVERMLKPFKGCTGLTEITFLGDAPVILDDEAFEGVTATAYYPAGNDTWTEEVLQQYGGTITWVAVPSIPVLELDVAQDVTYAENNVFCTYRFTPAEDGCFEIFVDADINVWVDIYPLDHSTYHGCRIAGGSGDSLKETLEGGVTYEIGTGIESGAPAEGTIWISAAEQYVTGLEVTSLPHRQTYVKGFAQNALDLSGLEMTVTWADGTTTAYVHDSHYYTIGDYGLRVEVDEETGLVTLGCCLVSTSFSVELSENRVAKLELVNADEIPGLLENAYMDRGEYYTHVITRKAQLRVTYTDGTTEILRVGDEVDGYPIRSAERVEGPGGINSLMFILLGATDTYDAAFVENPVASIELVSDPDPLIYGVDPAVSKNEEGKLVFSNEWGYCFEGLTFRINYTDGTSEVVSFTDLTWPAAGEDFYSLPEYKDYPVEAMLHLPAFGEEWVYWMGPAVAENGEVAMRLHYMGSIVDFTLTLQESGPVTDLNGWNQVDGVWYYYQDGAPVTGWLKDGGYWFYLDSTGAMTTGWVKVNGHWYYMNKSGVMQTGWVKVNGYWYYFASGGAMQTGWQKINGYWYYFASGGAMQTGWQKINGYWYYFASGGAMQTGWQKINGYWYYFASGGAMQTGWTQVNGKWYYLASGGAMQTGWLKLNGYWYYLDATGAMVTGTHVIDGKTYTFNSNGVWVA